MLVVGNTVDVGTDVVDSDVTRVVRTVVGTWLSFWVACISIHLSRWRFASR
jgi:hypothetical protein